MLFDVVRNMWSWDSSYGVDSALMSTFLALVSIVLRDRRFLAAMDADANRIMSIARFMLRLAVPGGSFGPATGWPCSCRRTN